MPSAESRVISFLVASRWSRRVGVVVAVGWMTTLAFALHHFSVYETTPGLTAHPPETWPQNSRISRTAGTYNLILFLHGHCACSTATVDELARIVAQLHGRLSVHAEFVRPAESNDDWARTSLYQTAAAIPGVIAEIDEDAAEATRFSAATSGQAVLYDPKGQLLFSGGITLSRGHEGDNPGESAIVDFVNGDVASVTRTPVFGCALSNDPVASLSGKEAVCPR